MFFIYQATVSVMCLPLPCEFVPHSCHEFPLTQPWIFWNCLLWLSIPFKIAGFEYIFLKIIVPSWTWDLKLIFCPIACFYLTLTLTPFNFSLYFIVSITHPHSSIIFNSHCPILFEQLTQTLTNIFHPLIVWI